MFVVINRIGFYEKEFISVTISKNQTEVEKHLDFIIYRKAGRDLKLWKVLWDNERYETSVFDDQGVLEGGIRDGQLVEYRISNGIERFHIIGTAMNLK